jgi:predicted XRE-type DNA-binding protein
VASPGIVPALDKLEDGHFCFGFGFKRSAVQELGFERGEETLAHRKLVQELNKARREAGLSQQQVADRLGVPQSYVAKIELGERRIDVIEFLKFVEALDATWSEILG